MKMKVEGIADVNKILKTIAPREAKNLMRATVHDMAGQLAKDAKKHAPRDDGDLYRSIKAKRERAKRDRVASSVIVQRKAFYWRFLEYGDGPDGVEHAFFLRALQRMRVNISTTYVETFARKLEARLKRLRK